MSKCRGRPVRHISKAANSLNTLCFAGRTHRCDQFWVSRLADINHIKPARIPRNIGMAPNNIYF
jgi:hypothetical protein